tara:strand:+ start:95 stop:271 length:177 start_codon:yes stop_codon:yes gene_type:complete
MIEEFITYKGFVYKKVGVMDSIIKQCPNCNKQFFTKEQRKKYCNNLCKTQYWRKTNQF